MRTPDDATATEGEGDFIFVMLNICIIAQVLFVTGL